MSSPGFSSFRSLMDDWDLYLAEENLENKIQSLLDSGLYTLFIKKDGDVYGVPEEDRIIFARMKNPDEESNGFEEDASFMGSNLSKAVKGEQSQVVFNKKDLESIKVLSEKKTLKLLLQHAKSKDDTTSSSILIIKQS
jgi:hypothetical protein